MSLVVTVPLVTEVINLNPDCTFTASYRDGKLIIMVDTREQNVHERLGLWRRTKLYWGKEHEYEAQELSGLAWPIQYHVLTRDGYYKKDGQRVHFTTFVRGLDSNRGASETLMRAAALLFVVAGIGYRKAAWLLWELFRVEVSKSSLGRWVEAIAATLPSSNEMLKQLNERLPIGEGHLDELYPRGAAVCMLVLKDEHGRILAMEEVPKRDERHVVAFLQRFTNVGIKFRAFYIDGCKAYYNAIRTVFGRSVAIQYDYFHIIQNAWRHLWLWMLQHRREQLKRGKESATQWYERKLVDLAQLLWENRYVLFKAEHRLTDQERGKLAYIMDTDRQVGRLRTFLRGIWHIFEDSTDMDRARVALAELKALPVDKNNPEPFKKVLKFLETNFEWMTAYLRHPGVKRNSLAESGMRVLRRLEIDHDGFRTPKGRDDCLRIYQAVKYLNWKVHRVEAPSGN